MRREIAAARSKLRTTGTNKSMYKETQYNNVE